MPIQDHWQGFFTILIKHHEGTLGFADFVAQHNEHRIPVANLVFYVLSLITGWNTNAELALSLITAVATFGLLLVMMRKTFADSRVLYFAGAVISSVIFFSPMAAENWLWGWELAWYLNVFGTVLAVWALHTWQSPRLGLRTAVAILGVTIATYTLGSGIYVWIICLPLFLLSPPLRRWVWLWLGFGVLELGAYFTGYQVPPAANGKSSVQVLLDSPLSYLEYLGIWLAHPVMPMTGQKRMMLAGAFLAVCLAVGTWLLSRKGKLSAITPWLVLAAYPVSAAVTSGLTRLAYGAHQAEANRYVTIANLLSITVIVVLLLVFQTYQGSLAKPAAAVAVALVAAGALLNYRTGQTDMQEWYAETAAAKQCAATATGPTDPCLKLIHPDGKFAWERLQTWRSLHYGE